jgi:hypothetical protein
MSTEYALDGTDSLFQIAPESELPRITGENKDEPEVENPAV